MAALTEWKVPPSAQPRAGGLCLRSRARAVRGGRPAFDHSARRLHRRDARHRARRQRRADRRRPGADHRLSDHRGGDRLAASRRRPRGARPCARLSTRRPASAWCRRSARLDLPALPLGSSRAAEVGERVVVGGVGGRTALARRPHRRQAGIRRLLGIRAATRRSSPIRRIPIGAAPR